MRLATLISSYLTIALIALVVLANMVTPNDASGNTFIGAVMFLVAPILAIIYAHLSK